MGLSNHFKLAMIWLQGLERSLAELIAFHLLHPAAIWALPVHEHVARLIGNASERHSDGVQSKSGVVVRKSILE